MILLCESRPQAPGRERPINLSVWPQPTRDFDNRLSSVTLPGTGGTVSLKYDPFGRRIEKISPTATSAYLFSRI